MNFNRILLVFFHSYLSYLVSFVFGRIFRVKEFTMNVTKKHIKKSFEARKSNRKLLISVFFEIV